jgi:hypothetical protein
MWIFTTDGFISVVAHRDKPDTVLVRARDRRHLEAMTRGPDGLTTVRYECSDVIELPSADYRYRVEMPRDEFRSLVADAAESIEYDNFKGACAQNGLGGWWLRSLHAVWSILREHQDRNG